jgi:hypothetical protein
MALYTAIVLVVRDVENKKQIHLSDDERHGLAVELVRLGEPIEKIIQRAKFVIRNSEYGRIPLDVWINAEPLFTYREAIQLHEKLNRQRIAEIQKTDLSEEALIREGLLSVAYVKSRRVAEVEDRLRNKSEAIID